MSIHDVNSSAGSVATTSQETTQPNNTDTNANVAVRDPALDAIWNKQNKSFFETQSEQMRAEALLAQKTDGNYNTPNAHGGTGKAIKAFQQAGIPVPSAHTVNRTQNALDHSPQMQHFVQKLTQGVTGQNGAKLAPGEIQTSAHALANQAEKQQNPTGSTESQTDKDLKNTEYLDNKLLNQATSVMSVMFVALAASMDEDNKIKMGRIKDLQKYNKISSLINNYISTVLQPAQEQLDKKTSGKKDTTNVTVPVATFDNVDPDVLLIDKNGVAGLSATGGTTLKRLSASGLSSALSTAQGWAQSASNNSEQMSNRYQSVDNHSNQSFTMLTGILKNINDSASNIGRNIA